MNIEDLYQLFLDYPTVTTDSRNCPTESLFFALKGDAFDGNKFALRALENGCRFAIIDNPIDWVDDRMIVVDDVLKTLQQLANYHRRQLKTPVIGITGTNGKTTTKELVSQVLKASYNTLYTFGNFNNHIGVPLTLLRLTKEHEMAVIEMGANHVGEIAELCSIAEPDYGLITNVGYAHLEGFGSLDGVLRTKSELYDFLRKKNGLIFIHQEDDLLKSVSKGLHAITYGESSKADIIGKIKSLQPFLSLNWSYKEELFSLETHLIGGYNLMNVLAAIAIGVYFKIDGTQINKALSEYLPTNNRSQWKQTDRNELVIDAYNANPSSMKVAIRNFAAIDSPSKVLILGDMRELGIESKRFHQEIVDELKIQSDFDKILLCGQSFMEVANGFQCFSSVDQLGEYLQQQPINGCTILIKGSNSVKLEKLVELL